jgi:hypothetical protein
MHSNETHAPAALCLKRQLGMLPQPMLSASIAQQGPQALCSQPRGMLTTGDVAPGRGPPLCSCAVLRLPAGVRPPARPPPGDPLKPSFCPAAPLVTCHRWQRWYRLTRHQPSCVCNPAAALCNEEAPWLACCSRLPLSHSRRPVIQQEAAYNMGRAAHQLGLLHLAVPLYERALRCGAALH